MAKYRCPVCGATHKQPPVKCRLCGQDMTSEAMIPLTPPAARAAPGRKKGLGSLFLIAAAGVTVLVGLAVLLGLTGDRGFVDNLRDEIPGLAPTGRDGWQTLDDGDGGFTAELPGEPTERFVPYPPAAEGRMDQWVSTLGQETELTIAYAEVTRPPGTSDKAALVTYGDAWAAQLGGDVDDREETSFAGLPALLLTIDRLEYEDEIATARALLVLNGERLYVVQSLSVYPDHPQFARVANSLTFTG